MRTNGQSKRKQPTRDLADDIRAFAATQTEPFSFASLVRHLLGLGYTRRELVPERVEELLQGSGEVVYEARAKIVPREPAMRNCRFLIVPSEEEVEGGYLIPGHRFIAVSSRDVLPWDCTLSFSQSEIPKRTIDRRLSELVDYYSLFDPQHLPTIFSQDYRKNADAFSLAEPGEQEMHITVFDMAGFYERHAFTYGDAVVMTVRDWRQGVYDLEFLRGPERGKRMAADPDWLPRWERALTRALTLTGTAEVEEQLAAALVMEPSLCRDPVTNLGGFVEASQKFGLFTARYESYLWFVNREAPPRISDQSRVRPRGDMDSLEAILTDVGIALDEVEVEAVILDALYRGPLDGEAVERRMTAGRDIRFYDQEQERAFHRFLEGMVRELEEEYVRTDDTLVGPIRERALQFLDEQLAFLHVLDARGVQPSDFPSDVVDQSSAAAQLIHEVLLHTNEPDLLSQRDTEELDQKLDAVYEFMQHAQNAMMSALGAASVDEEEEPAEAEHVYTLSVVLDGTDPPVWRRLRVPGNLSLSDLHEVIQIAMGWQDTHLHEFVFDGVHYAQSRGAIDPFGVSADAEPEDEVMLDEVLRSTGQRLRYTYDFGDNWQHTVTVEEMLSAESRESEPVGQIVCLDGERACPPEDAGGVPGYRELQAALQDPNHPNHDELCSWVGGHFDPDRFDKDAVNRELATY